MSQPKKKNSTTSTPSSPAENSAAPRSRRPWIIGGVVAGLGIIAIVGTIGFVYAKESRGIVSSVTVAGIDVGGMSSLAALETIETAWEKVQAGNMAFSINEKKFSYPVVAAGPDDTVLEYATFEPIEAVNEALRFGHRGSVWQQIRERVSGWLGRPHAFGHVTVAADDVRDLLAEDATSFVVAPRDASITVSADGSVVITDAIRGQEPNTRQAVEAMARQVRKLELVPIAVPVVSVSATYEKSAELQSIADAGVPTVLARAPITLTLDNQKWTVTKTKLQNLLGFRTSTAGQTRVGFDVAKTSAYLETLRTSIDQKPQEARFSIKNGKVEAFSTSRVGKSLDVVTTLARLNAMLDGESSTTAIAVAEQKPVSEGVAENDLGITELVAEAKTNFKGSPTNRRYNLSHGASLLNGLMIQPGETFSLVTALGKIDGDHGWKPELVIKGSKITPEFGGGLCQVATTLFRTALNAGLPIVERTNHSLRISYYEPPVGLDATIYEPKPDLRFRNDYTHPLLIQTEVSGTFLVFRFYGTKDGRTVDLPTPKVFNRVAIPKTTTVETTELKPGQKQCQTPGHPGADAIATYTVTKADGSKVVQTFKSHYRAIGVICRVGKKTTTTKPATNTNASKNVNTSTPTNINTAPETNVNGG